MHLFNRHVLVREDGENTVLLYIHPELTEFASELGNREDSREKLHEFVNEYTRRHIPNFRVGVVKIMLGGMLFASIPFKDLEVSAASYNMSYIYFGNTATQIGYIDRTKNSVSTASPSYFDLNSDGTLKLSKQFNTTFISEMKRRDVSIVPFLSNHWNRDLGRAALKNREVLATQIATAVEQYQLDGVNVDIENVTEIDRDAYVDFVRLLREKIPTKKEVSVAVAANPYGWAKGWHGSYDYKRLANHADYLMIMSYDESYQGGSPGPVASINWVEKGIIYALNQGVPKDKIVLGIPFFARYWNTEETYGGRGMPKSMVDELVQKYNGRVDYDELTQSPRAEFTIKEGDPRTAIYNRTLTNGQYLLWYENERSIKAKIDLVHKYQLKGTGSWALGQENPILWENYKRWLSGEPFKDILSHWAREDIRSIYERGWMRGTEEGVFSPNQVVTRAQAATILVRAFQLPRLDKELKFNDVSLNHWAKGDVEIAAQHGIIRGTGINTFGPNEPMTREQLAVILDRILIDKRVHDPNEPILAPAFSDITKNRWSFPSVSRMNKMGVVRGAGGNNEFKPTDHVTRAEMAAMLNRMFSLLPKNIQH